jgi:proteasome lid subunit RPN8/RPN11
MIAKDQLERISRLFLKMIPSVIPFFHAPGKESDGKMDKKADGSNGTPALRVTKAVYEEIRNSIGALRAEHGGALGGDRTAGIITHFHFDNSARRTGVTYSPDHETLNRLFTESWNPTGVNLLGFVHSHPPGYRQPSGGDITYAERILKHIPELKRLYLPIVMTEPDTGKFELLAYCAVLEEDELQVERLPVEIVDEEILRQPKREERADLKAEQAQEEAEAEPIVIPHKPLSGIYGSATYSRVVGAYDLARLSDSRLIYVGCGGAASFIEDLARAGVGQHILIDPDTVSETNLATQQVYRRDLGRAKVECLAERIADINPEALVVPITKRLEEIDDRSFAELACDPINGRFPAVTIICGLTDDFQTQARINRLALKFLLPSLCAQVYREGRGAEITFTYPGVTPACHRCALNSRYHAYLEEDFQNNVTAHGTPIFSTTRLNALKGFVIMALLHHDMEPVCIDPVTQTEIEKPCYRRWGTLLERIGNRNLIQIRMDPDIEASLGLATFARAFSGADRERVLFDEVIWLPQQPDCPKNNYPHCPDCGGTGDLRSASTRIKDTREMIR